MNRMASVRASSVLVSFSLLLSLQCIVGVYLRLRFYFLQCVVMSSCHHSCFEESCASGYFEFHLQYMHPHAQCRLLFERKRKSTNGRNAPCTNQITLPTLSSTARHARKTQCQSTNSALDDVVLPAFMSFYHHSSLHREKLCVRVVPRFISIHKSHCTMYSSFPARNNHMHQCTQRTTLTHAKHSVSQQTAHWMLPSCRKPKRTRGASHQQRHTGYPAASPGAR